MSIPFASPSKRQSLTALVLFCLLTGGLASLWGYSYSGGNQIEQLPLVLRAIDPNFLTQDFFTNYFDRTSPRYFFAQFIAILANRVPLPAVYLGLTLLANMLTALVSGLFARDLFDESDAAGISAALAVMAAKTFWLGYSNVIYRTSLEPSLLAMPLLLAAFWAGLRQRAMLCAAAAGIAALFHPLMGLETGAILLGVLGLEQAANRARPLRFQRRANLPVILGAAVILTGFAAIVLGPNSAIPHISQDQFIQILAVFRHPHHYLPSTFEPWQYLQAAAFIFPAGLAWVLTYDHFTRLRELTPALLAVCASLVGLCIGGYVFVELIPNRLWVTAQTFRLLYMAKWLGLVLIGGWLGQTFVTAHNTFREKSGRGSIADRVIFLQRLLTLTASLLSPITLSLVFCVELLRWKWTAWKRLEALEGSNRLYVVYWGLILAIGLSLAFFTPETRVLVLVPAFTLMGMALYLLRSAWLAWTFNLGLGLFLTASLLLGNQFLPTFLQVGNDKPIFSLEDLSGEEIDVANYARQNTPADAVFVVNPSMGLFRVTARRAIVVDFAAFPFTDLAMAEWQQRIYDCYGIPKAIGFPAVSELRDNYTAITDKQLLQLRDRYKASYAVLYRSTKTSFPTLFETKDYQVVKFPTR